MRPLELRLRNFRSYFGSEETFDFRGRRLVGIVGPIGSGKSSILDAMAFALYGKTPSIARTTKTLIHQRADDGAVALRFEVDGEVWEAVRLLRRGGAGQHALYRFASDQADAEIVERVLQEGEVNTKVAALLGLEFDAFTRSVLLAQGRFAEFLTAQPADRDRVLKGLFGHSRVDQMRELARGRHREAEVEAEKLAIRVEQVTELTVQMESERAQLEAAQDRVERLVEAEAGLTELAGEAADLARVAESLLARLQELDELAHRLPDQDHSAALLTRAAEAAGERAAAGEALQLAEGRLKGAREALAELEKHGGRAAIGEAAELVRERRALTERRADLVARIAGHDERMVSAARQLETAREELGAAAIRLRSAEEMATLADDEAATSEARLHAARHANMAGELRSGLAPGDRCPVCAQEVSVVPPATVDGAVTEAERALADARSRRGQAERDRLDASSAEAAARAAVESAERVVEALHADRTAEQARLPEVEDAEQSVAEALTVVLGEGDPVSLLETMRRSYDEATSRVEESAAAVERARAGLDDAIAAQQHVESAMSELRLQLVDAAARLGADIDVVDTPQGIGSALGELRERWQAERTDGRERHAEAAERTATVAAKRDALLAALGVEGDFSAALAAARERAALLAESLERLETRIEEGEALRTALEGQTARRDTFARLAADLTDAKFVRYLLDEERTRLCLLGSDHFQRLSSGRYRFLEDGSFDIVDLTTADAVRKADSLSGGETFLASLGLALALAEMVARTGGRLDAFFLDEGFGTLDPEHLDLAMEGIEALVADGADRLVVVVSHVPELRHRIDDLIVLDRDPGTGDTKVVRR